MGEFVINGGNRLVGEINIQGSKNSVLPIMAATLLTDDECVINNCPDISDVKAATEIMADLGARVSKRGNSIAVCGAGAEGSIIQKSLMEKMRSSVMFMGAILAKRGEILLCRPGGCKIGSRPIDIHINSLKSLGAEIEELGDCIHCRLQKVRPGDVTLIYPSVGATENIMLMCAASGQRVRIHNPAREPEIIDLQNFLNCMGAKITGAGSDTIEIMPEKGLCGCEYSIMPDRIVAATYAISVAACGGNVIIQGAEERYMRLVTEVLRVCGCDVKCGKDFIRIKSDGRLKAVREIKTLPYPGFPTDVQPILCAALATADGTSAICEGIFENRFGYVKELTKMGACIEIENCCARIKGVARLRGAEVAAGDLRGGAALVSAGLCANGVTTVSGVEFIDRGYEKIQENLRSLGAEIYRI